MNFNSITEIFVKNIMLRSGNKLLSIMNEDDVFLAVKKSYEAMQPRTFERNNDCTNWKKIDEAKKQTWFINISKYIVSYFKNPDINFDKWHNETCNKILNELNRLLVNAGYKTVAYGKAQKILNVSFKLLYLYDDASVFAHLFKDCHFIIDGTNLQWYNKVAKTKIKTWSDLTYDKYKEIQKNIRNVLNCQRKYPQNPFEAEFYIWADYQF